MSNRNAARLELTLLYPTLVDGVQQAGLLCPFCNGGIDGEASLSCKRDGPLLWFKCHRNSCGEQGCIGITGHRTISDTKAVRAPKPYVRRITNLPEDAREFLASRFGFTDWHFEQGRVAWCPEDSRVWYPLLDRYGSEFGGSARAYPELTPEFDKKSIVYRDRTDVPVMSWYGDSNLNTVVLVEDQVSAIRVSKFTRCVALIGTHLSDDKLLDIVAAPGTYTRVLVCLDKDATQTAFTIAKKLSTFIGHSRVRILERDLKDLSDSEVLDKLSL